MLQPTDDLRITEVRPLMSPGILLEEIPISDPATALVRSTRMAITRAMQRSDPRLVVIVGPCSIHDPRAAVEYAERLATISRRFKDELIVVMRAYFEKPRTSVGWKGLINDPDLDGTFRINKGLRLARQLLLDVNTLGLPTACEFLDTQIPQYLSDLTSWVAIGARTTESQIHRELASGLSMPVGFKNSTDGNVRTAVDAVTSAARSHWFPGVTKEGIGAIFHTTGNEACHVILRGGTVSGPNYSPDHVAKVSEELARQGLQSSMMIDCSHGNSLKDHRKQATVSSAVGDQVASGSWRIFGVMIESHLLEGRQDYVAGKTATYGQSITDACLSLAQTEPLLVALARAQVARGAAPGPATR